MGQDKNIIDLLFSITSNTKRGRSLTFRHFIIYPHLLNIDHLEQKMVKINSKFKKKIELA
ncbi:hypothetical protein CVD27_03540 [Neobacillus cucumis]|uniref:Uncharacterized protein n=1 Tax=Neobacillus cucumis TaxID=1740721 RepID=A0A2N5HSI5_9BACI|nr:hypothetical protein CVD27_03540 [Neobacillus cucumis]